jgi:hypothetical protein
MMARRDEGEVCAQWEGQGAWWEERGDGTELIELTRGGGRLTFEIEVIT